MWYYHVTGVKKEGFYFVGTFESKFLPKDDQLSLEAEIASLYNNEAARYERLYVVAFNLEQQVLGWPMTQSFTLERAQRVPVYKWTPAIV